MKCKIFWCIVWQRDTEKEINDFLASVKEIVQVAQSSCSTKTSEGLENVMTQVTIFYRDE